jgi:hypothetical protein
MNMKTNTVLLVALLAFAVTIGCVPPARYRAARPAPPAPCTVPVGPITGNSLVVSISVNYTYNAKDPTQARPWHQEDVLEHLNSLGKSDSNTFSFQNGNPVNFYFNYTINNDGQDHFTGSLQFSGWGQGFIHSFGTQYSYTDTGLMTRDLTTQAYGFVHTGWHDSRPGCENGPVTPVPASGKRKK